LLAGRELDGDTLAALWLAGGALQLVALAPATATAVFGLGLGWNVSFVAATTELTERTRSWERGRLLGFNDLLSGATGAGLTLLGGLALAAAGVAALAIGAMALVAAPALWCWAPGPRGDAPYPARATTPG
jgi:hypothetical protein